MGSAPNAAGIRTNQAVLTSGPTLDGTTRSVLARVSGSGRSLFDLHALGDFARDPVAGFQRPLHPGADRGSMLTGEEHSSLGSACGRVHFYHLAGLETGVSAASVLILVPAFGHRAFEVIMEAGKYLVDILERYSNSFGLLEGRQSARRRARGIGNQHSSLAGAPVGKIPDLANGEICLRKAAKVIFGPESILGLKENLGAGSVWHLTDGSLLLGRKGG